MKHVAVVVLSLLCISPAQAERPLWQVLFDFEEGIDGWTTNVWGGGGTVTLSDAEQPKFGTAALRSDVAGVEKGGNTISPWLPVDADWRAHDWGAVSLWFKGDGTPTRASLRVHTGEGEKITQSYSFSLPMDSTEWRRISAPVASFWNRHRVPMDTRKIVRIYIGHTGSHHFEVDQIMLEAPQRPVPLTKTGGGDLSFAPELLQFGDGRYALRFDPSPLLPGPAGVKAEYALPAVKHTVGEQVQGATAVGEALLAAPAAQQSGEATLTLKVARGQEAASAAWRFDVVAGRPLPDPTRLSLLPAPKECTLGDGAFPLAGEVSIVGTGEVSQMAVELLAESLAKVVSGTTVGYAAQRGDCPVVQLGAGCDASDHALARLADLPAGGYLLNVGNRGATVRANDAEGLRNGVLTLLQAWESHFALTGEQAIPEMHVVDWPNMPIRAVSLPLPSNRWGHPNDSPADPDMFLDFLHRTMVRTKMNMAVLIVHQAMQYETHPAVAGPAAWSREEVKRVFDTLRKWGVEPVPHMNSLGHMNWLCIPYRNRGLAEDGDVHQICTSHPDAERIVKEIYGEIIDLVEPKVFHVGLDEIRWKTHALPESERCPRCAGKSKQDIFVEWTAMLHEFLAGRGIQMMMWGDMILPGHNGGPPYNLAETVDRMPKNVLIANWSTRMTPESHAWLLDRGFAGIVKSNSRGATLAEQQLLVGNMFGCWYKVPWLVEGTQEKLELNAYGSFLAAAEYSWNHWTDPFDPMPPIHAEFFAKRPLVQWRMGSQPVAGGEMLQLSLPASTAIEGLPIGPVSFGHLRFEVAGGLMPEPGAEADVPVARRAKALYLLHGARLLDREAMVESLKAKQHWDGVPIAEYVVSYASGATETIPVRYSMELRDPQEGWCEAPIVYNSLGVTPMTCESEGFHLYAMQWRNPRPADPIASIALRQTGREARVVLAGVVVQ
ncbi:MAG: glycoside hydrolase family 20 zincin-like fold domain-containing protein [Thermoguttaceae bacterium]|jgi:hypothetical protein|nr:glycoside hydrolase family 20 zincin-like fold domain-containing protein [Thermoguttaceae bacterium]